MFLLKNVKFVHVIKYIKIRVFFPKRMEKLCTIHRRRLLLTACGRSHVSLMLILRLWIENRKNHKKAMLTTLT